MASISAALTASQASLSAARRRAVLAATVGNALEWYDFLIYGFLAMTIAKLFFPTESELTSLLLSVGTFGAAAVVRPVASVVLGIYADRVGRKAALTLTIFTMGLGTGLIVVAPTYASIGIWAAVLMVSARLLQGFACGGEMGEQRRFSSRTRRITAEACTRAGRQRAKRRESCSARWSRCWFLCQ